MEYQGLGGQSIERIDFASITIVQLIVGLNAAIVYGKEHNAIVNPTGHLTFSEQVSFGRETRMGETIQIVDFAD